MRRFVITVVAFGSVLAAVVKAGEPTIAEVTHGQLQAVDADGFGTYLATDKVVIEGIVLNNPDAIFCGIIFWFDKTA